MFEILIILASLVLDQSSKIWAATTLAEHSGSMPIIQDVFHLTYTQNRGAAFGMLQNQYLLFVVVTIFALGVMAYILITERKNVSIWFRIALSLLFAGAAGNFIDRLLLHYVRDFLDFTLIDFAIFNIADACISVGAVLMAVSVLFIDGKKILVNNKTGETAPDTSGRKKSKCDSAKEDDKI